MLSPNRWPKTLNPSFWESRFLLSVKFINHSDVALFGLPEILAIAIVPIKFEFPGSLIISPFEITFTGYPPISLDARVGQVYPPPWITKLETNLWIKVLS